LTDIRGHDRRDFSGSIHGAPSHAVKNSTKTGRNRPSSEAKQFSRKGTQLQGPKNDVGAPKDGVGSKRAGRLSKNRQVAHAAMPQNEDKAE
jgi:hypothetical protein